MPRSVAIAKLTRPRLQSVHPRRRLFALLTEAAGHGSVWVEAPPGAGKTTLVAGWLEQARVPALWYRVDACDADVATLFHYLGVAASQAARSRASWPRFRPEQALDVAAFARGWFRAVYAALVTPFALVLDSYQDAPPRSPLDEVLRVALEELPAGACAVVTSREPPPVSLARLRAEGSLTVMGPAALRLDAAESRAVARLRGSGRSERAIAALHERTGGWVAGLVLLLAGLDTASSGPEVQAAQLFDYLAGEVLERTPAPVQRVLLETALLPQVSATEARAVTGVQAAGEILADLACRGYFTLRHEGADPVYTYHPLFREFLLDRARRTIGPERIAEVMSTAAGALAQRGEVIQAAALLRDAGAHAQQAELLVAHARELLEQGRAETLRGLIEGLPPKIVEDQPWLSYWLGMAQLSIELEPARAALERAHASFLRRDDARGAYLSCAAILDSYALEWVDFRPLPRWIEAFEALRRRWPDCPDEEVEARAACGMYAALMSVRPRDPALPAWAGRVRALAARGPPELRTRASFTLAHFHLWRGDLPAARAALDELAAMQSAGDPFTAIGCIVHAGRLAASGGAGPAALARAEEALARASTTGEHWWDFGALLVGAWGATLAGDAVGRVTYLTGLERAFDPTMDAYFQQARALALLRADGDVEAAREHLERSLAIDDAHGALYPASWDHVGLAAIARSRGDPEALARHLAEAERLGELTGSRIVRYWTSLLRAVERYGIDGPAAVACAAEALRLSQEFGPYDELFVPEEAVARACALALEAGIASSEARKVVVRRTPHLEPPPDMAVDDWPWPIVVRVLGDLTVERDGVRAPPLAERSRPLDLLAALIALGGAEVQEWRLTEALWPEAEGDAAQHALEMNVSRLRKLLGDRDVIVQHQRQLSVGRACWVDAVALEAWLKREHTKRGAEEARRAAARVLGLYRGPFLTGQEAGWARPTRERLRRRVGARAGEIAEVLARHGEPEEAGTFLAELARRDPGIVPAPSR